MDSYNFDTKITLDSEVTNSPNLTSRFGKQDLGKIGGLVTDGYKADKLSRTNWERRTEAAMDLALQMTKAKNFPWPGASNVIFPLVTIAALQFSARSYENIIQGTDVVKYRVIGEDEDGKLTARAERIGRHMSWQCLEQDESWEEQHDRLLINLGIVGTSIIKTYYSGRLKHNVSELVLARDFVIDYWAKSTNDCARKTHRFPLYRNEIYSRVKSGVFRDCLSESWYTARSINPETGAEQDQRRGSDPAMPDVDTPFMVLEQHRDLDLDGDGYAEPYIVTVEEVSGEVLRIVARWSDDAAIRRTSAGEILEIEADEYFTKFGFIPSPDAGFYDIGFGVLLGPLNESVNSGINQLLDAGTMANSNAGFLGRGAKIRGGAYTFAPWEWQRVDSTGDDIRKSLVQFPIREPSGVMLSLLQLLIEYTSQISGAVDQMVGKNPGQNTPAETSRNTLEQGMRVYNSVFKRVWRALKEEFRKLHKLNRMYLPSGYRFGDNGQNEARAEDYQSDSQLCVPSADPTITSQAQRIMQAQHLRELAMTAAGYDKEVVERRVLKALQIEGINEVYPGVQKTGPMPNPKVQVEQMKQQTAKDKTDKAHVEKMAKIALEAKEANAQIELIYAQIYQIMQETQDAKTDQKLRAFESVVSILEGQQKLRHEELKANTAEVKMQAAAQKAELDGGSDGDSDSGNGGGMGAGADGAGNAGTSPAPAQPAGQAA